MVGLGRIPTGTQKPEARREPMDSAYKPSVGEAEPRNTPDKGCLGSLKRALAHFESLAPQSCTAPKQSAFHPPPTDALYEAEEQSNSTRQPVVEKSAHPQK